MFLNQMRVSREILMGDLNLEKVKALLGIGLKINSHECKLNAIASKCRKFIDRVEWTLCG